MPQSELHDFESPECTISRVKRMREHVVGREGPPEVNL